MVTSPPLDAEAAQALAMAEDERAGIKESHVEEAKQTEAPMEGAEQGMSSDEEGLVSDKSESPPPPEKPRPARRGDQHPVLPPSITEQGLQMMQALARARHRERMGLPYEYEDTSERRDQDSDDDIDDRFERRRPRSDDGHESDRSESPPLPIESAPEMERRERGERRRESVSDAEWAASDREEDQSFRDGPVPDPHPCDEGYDPRRRSNNQRFPPTRSEILHYEDDTIAPHYDYHWRPQPAPEEPETPEPHTAEEHRRLSDHYSPPRYGDSHPHSRRQSDTWIAPEYRDASGQQRRPSSSSSRVSRPPDDGWDAVWDPNMGLHFFFNRFNGTRQWENPRVTSQPEPKKEEPVHPAVVRGYNPAIHGNYDPNADYAIGADEEVEQNTTSQQDQSGGADYAATAAFNRSTGRFNNTDAHPTHTPDAHTDEAKSGWQMNAFFDVNAAANSRDGRSLKDERRTLKLTKKEYLAVKAKNKAKKEEKRRAWLRD